MRLWKALDDTILKLPFSLRVHLPRPRPPLAKVYGHTTTAHA